MENKNNKKIIIGITSLVLVTLILLGLTYAYYRTRIIGNPITNSINVVTKKLGISYSDNQPLITATNIEPGYNNEANPKTFTVHNTGDEKGSFSIILDNVVNEFNKGIETRGSYNDWTYELYEGTTISSDKLLKTGEITTEEKQVLIESALINSGAQITYTLIIRYADLINVNQSDDMGSKLSLRVNIEDSTTSGGTTQTNPLLNAQQGTLLYALRTNATVSEPKTKPGVEASAEDEAVFATTEDDYGTSYYFRGNVQNNYLNYSGMCWRIVRVDGNGNIKIVLADENGECNSTETYGGMGYSTANPASAFIGADAEGGQATVFTSGEFDFTIVQNWVTNNTLDTTKLVEEAEWCEDYSIKEINDETTENCYDYEEDGVDDFCYQQGYVTTDYTSETPTLKCDRVGLNNSKARKTTSIAGSLTKDEVVFAGAKLEFESNYSSIHRYYLLTNAVATINDTSFSYTTLSPAFEIEEYSETNTESAIDYYLIKDKGELGVSYRIHSVGADIYYRPAVVLKNTVTVTTDSESTYEAGTYQNPYVIS